MDTGALVSLLSRKEWERVKSLQELQMANMRVMCANRRPIPVAGTAVVEMLDARKGHHSRHRAWGHPGNGCTPCVVDAGQGNVNLDPPGLGEERPHSSAMEVEMVGPHRTPGMELDVLSGWCYMVGDQVVQGMLERIFFFFFCLRSPRKWR